MKTAILQALGFSLVLLAPLLFSPPSVRAGGCVSTGSLGNVLLNCPSPVGKSPKPAAKEPGSALFERNWILRIRVPQGDWHSAIRSGVAAWVARKIYPHPTMEERVLLNAAIRDLTRTGFPVEASKQSDLIARVRVTAETLNRIAARLEKAVRKGHPSYHVARVMVTGGTRKENQFAAAQIPVPTSGVVASDQMSQKLYDISQVPGFSRADGMMVPAIATRDLTFSLPHILTVQSTQKDWARDIRRQVVLLVANLLIDMKNPLGRKIAETLSRRLSRIPWPRLVIRKEKEDSYHVEISPLLLNTLKNILLQAAALGTVPETVSLADRAGQLSTGNLFAPPPAALEYDDFLVHLTPVPTFSGSQIEVDNYGYAPTGAVVLNATGTVNNALVAGGLFSVTASTTFGGMNSGMVGASLPIGLYVRAGTDLTAMNYLLGQGFSPWGHGTNAAALTALGVSGSNYSADLWVSQSLVQREDRRLALKETLFLKEFQDTYSPTVQNDRSLVGGILDLSGFRTSGRLSVSFDLSATEYDLSQGSSSSPLNPYYADTPGLQSYLTGNGQIGFAFTPKYSLVLGTVDQQYIGGGTLDPMLQATLGGVSNVMALPTASLFGNDLYVGSLTFTRSDPVEAGVFSTSGFFDLGEISGVVSSYLAMGPGLEESFNAAHFFARIDAAVPVGALPVVGLGTSITALAGGNIGQGGIPIQLWLSVGIRE
ncbi:MAG: hypothetical protein M1313_11015 [Nitrospirae bacterium]|nr:hypothetical protein [Nitrospirota bacterium]